MKSAVVDTSVIIKWFCVEKDGDLALRLREELVSGRVRIAAPDLLLYELANALRYHPRFRPEDAAAAVDSVAALGIRLIPPSPPLLRQAVELAFERNITVFDAVFAASAIQDEQPLLTADEKLAAKISGACRAIPLTRFFDHPTR